ncbi:MAG: SLBB domain-containing protein [Steroidobacteraceae bacterium]
MRQVKSSVRQWYLGICLALLLPSTLWAAGTGAVDVNRLAMLGPGDSVAVQVFGQPDMTTTVYVSDDGTIRVPLAGPVAVAGSTPVQAAQRVEKALRDAGYFVHPQVTLTLVQSRSERVSVLGDVKTPGSYAVDPATTVFDLLADAGGATTDAAAVGYVRRMGADGHVHEYSVDLRGTPGATNNLPDQRLDGGDELFVPQAQHVYVYGQVKMPDMYKWEPGMTVIQAVVLAGGITEKGSERHIQIKRLQPNGQYAVLHARSDDLVKPGDVIRVKESIF